MEFQCFECFIHEQTGQTPSEFWHENDASHCAALLSRWKDDVLSPYLKSKRKSISTEKRYRYMLTFTLKPNALNQADDAEKWIRQQAERKETLSLAYYAISKEHTKKGVPHWHVVVEALKPLKKDRFHYYTKKYGFIDFSRTKAQTTQEALNYISKEVTPDVIIS